MTFMFGVEMDGDKLAVLARMRCCVAIGNEKR